MTGPQDEFPGRIAPLPPVQVEAPFSAGDWESRRCKVSAIGVDDR